MPVVIPPFSNVPAPNDDVKSAWAQQLTQYAVDHVNDTNDAHDASAISFVPTGTIAATTVQAAIVEVSAEVSAGIIDHGLLLGLGDDDHPQYAKATDLALHISDEADAHDASAISFTPVGTIAATDVQAAIAELLSEGGAGGSAPGGSSRQVQFNNGDDLGGATKVEITTDGNLMLVGNTGFPVGAAGRTKVVDVAIGNRVLPFMIHEHGRPALVPPGGWVHGAVAPLITSPVAASLNPVGLPAPTVAGTLTAATIGVTGANAAATRKVELRVNTPATNAVVSVHSQIELFGVVQGGFIGSMRWAPALPQPSTSRAFCGFNNAGGSPTDVNPSSLVSQFGMGWDAGDTNVQVMHNDTSGVATKVDLGSGFPKAAESLYELIVYVPWGVAEINWMVINHQIGAMATGVTGVITTNMPDDGNTLGPRTWMSVGGTSSAIGMTLFGWDFWTAF